MARAIMGGLLFGAVTSLFVVPSFYVWLDDAIQAARRFFGRTRLSRRSYRSSTRNRSQVSSASTFGMRAALAPSVSPASTSPSENAIDSGVGEVSVRIAIARHLLQALAAHFHFLRNVRAGLKNGTGAPDLGHERFAVRTHTVVVCDLAREVASRASATSCVFTRRRHNTSA